MNKKYYEFVFLSDMGKKISFKITNALKTYNVQDIITDMNSIISSQVILTSQGRPIARQSAKFVDPRVTEITVLEEN